MHRRVRLSLSIVPLLLLASFAGPLVSAEEATEPIGTQRISSKTDAAGPAETYNASGTIAVPDGALEARFVLDWNVTGTGQAEEVTFELCPRDCQSEEVFAHTTAHPPTTWTTEVPELDTVGWHVHPDTPAPRGVNLTGTVTFLGPADPDPGEVEASATRAPAPDDEVLPVDAGTLAAAAGALATLAGLVYALRRWLPGGLVALFSRIPEDELLANDTRQAIYELVEAEPGIHFSEVARRLDLSHGRLQHHLGKMLDARLLAETRTGQRRCLLVPGQLPGALADKLAAAKSPGARSVLAAVAAGGETSIQGVAEASGVSVSTASYHVDRLDEEGLLETRRDGRRRKVRTTDVGTQVARLLGPAPANRSDG